jgi:hypothetical protein
MDLQIVIAILTVGLSAGVSWGVAQGQLRSHSKDIAELKSKQTDMQSKSEAGIEHLQSKTEASFLTLQVRTEADIERLQNKYDSDHDILLSIKTMLEFARIGELNDRLYRIENKQDQLAEGLSTVDRRLTRVEEKLGLG